MTSNVAARAGTHALVIEAAERLFTRFAYAKVTMDEIATEAGLKKPSLYYYCAGKEDIYRAVVEAKRAEFRGRITPLLDSPDPAAARIEQYVVARSDHFRDMQELNILDFKQVTGNAPALREMFKRHALEELNWLTQLFESGRSRGEFQLPSSRRMAEMFLHVLQGLRLRFMRESEGIRPDPAAFNRLRREMVMIAGVVLAGIDSRRTTRPGRSSRLLSNVVR